MTGRRNNRSGENEFERLADGRLADVIPADKKRVVVKIDHAARDAPKSLEIFRRLTRKKIPCQAFSDSQKPAIGRFGMHQTIRITAGFE